MKVFDVAVVGAGPAGSVAAFAAAKMGMDTVLIEREHKGRFKYCAGGISYGALEFLRRNVSKEVEETSELTIEGYVVFSPKGRILVGSLRGLVGLLVRRNVFDAKLMELAESAGAKLVERTNIVGLDVEEDRVVLSPSRGDKMAARYVVLATGAADRLGVKAGLPPVRIEQLGHCWGTEAEFPISDHLKLWRSEFGLIPIFLLFGVVKSGYAWFFPKARHMNVGIGTTLEESKRHGRERGGHRSKLQEVLRKAKEWNIITDSHGLAMDRSWIIPFGDLPRDGFVSEKSRILAVGDAAGFVHPVTGEGIYGAVVSGWLASGTIKEALDSEDPSRLREYEARCWNWFGVDMFTYGKKLARLLYSSTFVLELGLRGLMEDEKAVSLLGRMLVHVSDTATKELYEYTVRHLPILALKAVKAKEKRMYL